MLSFLDKTVAGILSNVGKRKIVSGKKAEQDLGFKYRGCEKSIKQMAHSIIRFGLVEMKPKYKEWLEKQEKSGKGENSKQEYVSFGV